MESKLDPSSLTSHPDACCCDWCHSTRTWNAAAGRWTWRSDAPPSKAAWAAAAGDSRPGRAAPVWSWHCAAGGGCCGWAMPPRASSSCRFGYRPTCPARCSSLEGCGSSPSKAARGSGYVCDSDQVHLLSARAYIILAFLVFHFHSSLAYYFRELEIHLRRTPAADWVLRNLFIVCWLLSAVCWVFSIHRTLH